MAFRDSPLRRRVRGWIQPGQKPCPRWVAATVLCGLLTVLLPSHLGAGDDTPAETIQKVYGAEIKKVQTTPDDGDNLELANKLVADARSMVANKAVHKAMLEQAMALALDAATGANTAENCVTLLVKSDEAPELDAWQQLVTMTAAAMRKRKKGKDDPYADQYCQWELAVAAIARAQGNDALSDKTLAALQRDAQIFKMKYLGDALRQLQVYRKLDSLQRTAVAQAKAKVKGDDPKENLTAAETILSQSGDWAAAEPFRRKAQDLRLNQIAQLREQRNAANEPPLVRELSAWSSMLAAPTPVPLPPPSLEDETALVPAPNASETLALADYLASLTTPAKRPSPSGRCALLEEAAALAGMVEGMDQSNLSVTQKLGLVTRIREAKETAQKARVEIVDAFDKECRLGWTALQGGKMANDWTPTSTFDTWKELDNGVLQCNGTVGPARLVSKRAGYVDFVLEGEFSRPVGEMSTSWILHRGTVWFRLDCWAEYTKATLWTANAAPTELARGSFSISGDDWHKVRVVFEGDRQRMWIDEKQVIDLHAKVPATSGATEIGAQYGASSFRNLRIRELK